MEIKRDYYLTKLINRMHNGLIKVVTGIRRCGKSYLLFNLFYEYLLSIGVKEDHIIKLALDNIKNKKYRNPEELYNYIETKIVDKDMYYVFLDEVQFVEEFEDVLNGFLHIKNVDTYITGSNAKFLSKDIITEFRGRGDQVHISPLSFKEFFSVYDGDKYSAFNDYMVYGGLPLITTLKTHEQKDNYLKSILNETLIKDIIDRNKIQRTDEFEELIDILSSSIGSLTNPLKLEKAFKSIKHLSLSAQTISNYLAYLEDSFVISKAKRYDIKGKSYIDSPFKYYFSDLGLRNARLNFRQIEETHALENIIYNELINRGYSVDVGVVTTYAATKDNPNRSKKNLEVDFVCNQADKRIYIQSALSLPNQEKIDQEQNSLNNINDSFKKIIITKDCSITHYNNDGILIMNLFDFLLNLDSLSK